MMRAKKSNDWPKLIKIIVRNINNSPSSKHGFCPAEVASPIDDQKIRDAMIKRKKYDPVEYDEVKKRIDRYNKSRAQNIIHKGATKTTWFYVWVFCTSKLFSCNLIKVVQP